MSIQQFVQGLTSTFYSDNILLSAIVAPFIGETSRNTRGHSDGGCNRANFNFKDIPCTSPINLDRKVSLVNATLFITVLTSTAILAGLKRDA